MKSIQHSSRPVVLLFLLLICISGCKSKKKAMEAAAEKARIEQEAANLKKQKERDEELKRQKAEDEARDAARKDAEAKQALEKANQLKAASTPTATRLSQYFSSIVSSPSIAAANGSINEAISMFASQDAPVLIIISGSGSEKDYDRPTTIKAYLNYLKDQKKNLNTIENLQVDGSGKITEVELRKN